MTTPLTPEVLGELRDANQKQWTATVADMSQNISAAKRVNLGRQDHMPEMDWWMGWGKSEGCFIEGTAHHWHWLAYIILGLVQESDAPYTEVKPLPFSPAYIRLACNLAPAMLDEITALRQRVAELEAVVEAAQARVNPPWRDCPCHEDNPCWDECSRVFIEGLQEALTKALDTYNARECGKESK